MMTLTEKVAYLKGLADGLGLDEKAKETKLYNAIFDILEDAALSIADLEDTVELIEEQLDAVDEDLDDLETFVYEDCCCDDDEDEDDDDGMYEVVCPACNETIYVDSDMFDEEFVECPACGEKLEFDIGFDCDCGCCDHDDEEEDD